MSETTKGPYQRWINDFTDELRLRHIDKTHASDALDGVREHLSDSRQTPSAAFGDPREYAASLNLPAHDDGVGRTGSLAAVFLASASFLSFGIALTYWMTGENRLGVILWTLGSATILLAASVWLTISIARHVVASAVRERFNGNDAGRWSRWAPIAIAAPLTFPIFATVLVAVTALNI